MASVISIGHISTIALAGITLGSMTASVTGFSVLQGLSSALDTLLPPAWTSKEPRLVGLWTQRIGKCKLTCHFAAKRSDYPGPAVVTAFALIVRVSFIVHLPGVHHISRCT
jgi:hypothetical protein